MDRRSGRYALEVPERAAPARLELLVYAMGRVNFGEQVFDRKGLHGPATLGGTSLDGWEVFPLPLDEAMLGDLRYGSEDSSGPAFWRGGFDLEATGDTFLDLSLWGKGVVWVNGRCLGRFWNVGPQQTLYLPGPWLRLGRNEVVVLDLLGPQEASLSGRAEPILDELRPDLDFARSRRAGGAFAPTVPVAAGAFTEEARWQEARFDAPARGRYLALEARSVFGDDPSAAVAGIDAFDSEGRPIPRTGWTVLWASSEETNYLPGDAEHALDGQTSTYWHSEAGASALPPPHAIVVDLGESREVAGIRYLPRSGDKVVTGRIRDYRVYLSDEPFGLTPPL
ncbi:beta-galactosidase, partial [bacterium]